MNDKKIVKIAAEKLKKEVIPLGDDDLYASSQSKVALKLPNDSSSDDSTSEDRVKWGGRFEFLLSCVGYSVGLGNVWRFGYLCAKSGGGAFLIPYFITLLIVAIPLMYMEFAVGQFTQRGPIGALRRLCPLLKGAGVATVVMLFFLTTYYVVIIGWDLYFMFASFGSEVPWKTCNNSWNTESCWDGTREMSVRPNETRSPSEEYFRRKILNESDSIENFGVPKLDLALVAILAWIIVYFCIWKGVKSSGKVVYVTAIFPYFVLIIMLVRGLTLEGASAGLEYFFIPKWENLAKPSVWANAAIQNFNSMGVAFGALISMSSYNKKDKKILGDVLSIACIDAATSILCGTVVFSVLGYVATTQGKTVDEIARPGPGLIFMVIPEALRNMSFSPFWSILFFLMIFMLGIDSQFSMVETVASTIEDEFKIHVKKYIKKKEILVLLVCIVTGLLSIPTLCPGGIYYFTIIDFFAAGISVFYVAFFEIVAICWIYGAKRLAKNITLMNGRKPNPYFLVCWYFITPVFILTIWAFNWYQYEPITYGKYVYPIWAQLLGWFIGLCSIMSIPLGALHTLVNAPGKTFIEKFMISLKPTIPDLDDLSNESMKPVAQNRAEIFKSNKIDPETIAF